LSSHDLSFPYTGSRNRDLSDAELWARSLRRSVHRREITEAARKHAVRRKGAAVAVTASMAAGPVAAPFTAVASVGGSRSVSGSTDTGSSSARAALSLPSGALVKFGDTGKAVAAVQNQVGVDDDGIFGPVTRGGVERFQARAGLPVTGTVDAKTWAVMFKSQVSYVGKDGKTSVTVKHQGGGAEAPSSAVDAPATTTKPVVKVKKKKAAAKKQGTATTPRTTAPATSTDPEKNRAAITNPQAISAPVAQGAGCGSGQIATPVAGTATGSFGENRGSHAHAGKDISARTGTAVRAAQCGTVTKAGWDNGGYGNLVCIEHEGGISTCYAHLSSVDTKVGQYVHVGDVVGKVGSTGRSTGPHLHFEVRENGKTVNPDTYLSGAKQIAGAAAKATSAATKASTGKLAVTKSGSDAAWGEATPASSAETEATLATAYTAAG